MVALKRLKLASRCREQPCPVVLCRTTVFTSRCAVEFEALHSLNIGATSRSTAALTQLVSPTRWLLTTDKSISCQPSGECISQQVAGLLMYSTNSNRTQFHDLPIEIHFQIATFLPGHALNILSWHGCNEKLRRIYQAADPRVKSIDLAELSAREKSIYSELRTRDVFENTPLPHRYASPVFKGIWTNSWFYCASCEISSRCSHFPLKEMEESRERRTGMSKITDRKCFARISPVKLWDKKFITWDQLQQAWTDMEGYSCTASSTLMKDHVYHPAKCQQKAAPGRYTDIPNTLQLHNLDHALTRSSISPGQHGVEATADYYIDLFTLFRFSSTDGPSLINALTRKRPYICPHLDLPRLFARPMSTDPIDFRPHDPAHSPSATVADVLCRTLEKAPWRPDPAVPNQRQEKPERKIKEQTIWCGFKGDKCRTAVCLQRFRDSSRGNSVGGLWGMRDLCRIRVVRRWRVDCGTGCEEWQAQNGVSMPAALQVF